MTKRATQVEPGAKRQTREKTSVAGVTKVTTSSPTGTSIGYQARFRSPDGRIHSKTFRRLDDARRYRSIALGDRDRGAWKDPRLDRVTFRAWSAGPQWAAHVEQLRPKTQAIYKRAIERALPILGDTPLPKIRRVDIVRLRDHLLKTSNAGGANQVLRVVKTCLQHAVEHELLNGNPAVRVRADDSTRPEERPERRALTPDEAGRLLAATPDRWRALVATSLTLGLRWSELAGLQRRHVDLEHAELVIERQAYYLPGKGLIVSEPKTRAGIRNVPIPADLAPLLGDHLDRFAQAGPDGIVFPSAHGRVMDNSSFRQTVWNPAQTTAAIAPRVVFHACRVTSTSWLIEAGVDPKTTSVLQGHSSPAITMSVYARSSTAARKVAADRVGAVLSGAIASTANVVPIASRRPRQADDVALESRR